MKRILFALMILAFTGQLFAQVKWYNPLEAPFPVIQGRAWQVENADNYHRLPPRAQGMVRPPVWWLSTSSSGLNILFKSNAPEIDVAFTLKQKSTTPNITQIASCGVDMYATNAQGEKLWCACPASMNWGKTPADTIHFVYKDLKDAQQGYTYQLFLPLMNEVTWMSIGIAQDCQLEFLPIRQEKPIVAYGTSICQGYSASRPAMTWTSQLSRALDWPVINLGFSGNALMDHEVYDLISEIDAQAYILDCMPNMYPVHDSIVARTIYGVNKIRSKSQAPILLVECDGYMYGRMNDPIQNEADVNNAELKKAYAELQRLGFKGIYYLTLEEIGISPDAQVDGWHASDIGMSEYARAYVKKLKEMGL